MHIRNFVFHEIIKNINETGAGRIIRPNEVAIDQKIIDFNTDVRKRYYSKSKSFGHFDDDSDRGFRIELDAYLNNEISFLDFTDKATNILADKMSSNAQATGGYIVFCHFDYEQMEMLSVLMLRNTKGYNIEEQILNIIQMLDVQGYDLGVQINITKRTNGESEYLSFLSGKKELSKYFTMFIGCAKLTNNKKESERLIKACKAHLSNLGIDSNESTNRTQDVKTYCLQCVNSNNTIHLSRISSIIDTDSPDRFTEFASSEEFQISSDFEGDRQTFKKMAMIEFASENFSIKFSSGLLRSDFEFDETRNQLIIKNLPTDLFEKLKNG